ncbi:MAG: DNA double-strand break repair nuclease NurA [Anaerolineae bacterium]|nr:DNA double-strand break repair nuclease NurA [Anaerolineae bacterium]
MLSRTHVLAALQSKQHLFATYQRRTQESYTSYKEALTQLAKKSHKELDQLLIPFSKPGARPTCERSPGRSIILPFQARWQNHRQAREWAKAILEGTITIAVDGSQITPDPSFSIPVGAIQVGWFVNPHTSERRYIKDILFEILGPSELAMDTDEGIFPDLQVNLRRFEQECALLRKHLQQVAQESPSPLCFFDGSLIASFAAHLAPELRQRYLRAVISLLDASEQYHVPLVGYIDFSRASDLLSMLQHLWNVEQSPHLSDATLLQPLMKWGDRTEAFVCARDDRTFDGLESSDYYYERVIFLYLKTTSSNPPVRLDIPRWVLEEGLLDQVINLVRAECIVGVGYPYALETADALAVLTAQDREQFYRIFQKFVAQMGIELRYSRKAYSKRGRRQ